MKGRRKNGKGGRETVWLNREGEGGRRKERKGTERKEGERRKGNKV